MAKRVLKTISLQDKYKDLTKNQEFFMQRYSELLYYKTFNSYQYNVNNGFTILRELLEVIEKTNDNIISSSNIKFLIDELHLLIKKDIVIKSKFPKIYSSLMSLKSKNYKDSTNYNIKNLELKINYAYQILNEDDNYIRAVFDMIEKELKLQELTDEIEVLTSILITQCLGLGIHERSLASFLHTLFIGDNRSKTKLVFVDQLQILKSFILDKEYIYKEDALLYVQPLQSSKGIGVNKLGLELKTSKDIISKLSSHKKNISKQHLDNSKEYIEIKFKLLSNNLFASVEKTMNDLEQDLSMLSFNDNIVRIDKGKIVVLVNDSKNIDKYKMIHNDDLFSIGSNKERQKLKSDFQSIKLLLRSIDSKDSDRIYSALKNYSMGVASYSQETVFIMLWSSLESLVKMGYYRSNIDHIIEIIPKILCLNYAYTLIEVFFQELISIKIKYIKFKSLETNDLINVDLTDEISSEKILFFYKLMNNKEYEVELISNGNYVLLDNRYKELKRKFVDFNEIKCILVQHEEKIRWHLYRLYRVRNSLVHAAKADTKISVLTEHLDYYVRELISSVLNHMDIIKKVGLGEYFLNIENEYNYLIDLLSERNNKQNEDQILDVLFGNSRY